MEIPSPRALAEQNKNKSFAAKEENDSVKLTPEEKELLKRKKIEEQANALFHKCCVELQKYKNATIIVPAPKFTTKEAMLNVINAFSEDGQWIVTKSYDPVEGEMVLKFKSAME